MLGGNRIMYEKDSIMACLKSGSFREACSLVENLPFSDSDSDNPEFGQAEIEILNSFFDMYSKSGNPSFFKEAHRSMEKALNYFYHMLFFVNSDFKSGFRNGLTDLAEKSGIQLEKIQPKIPKIIHYVWVGGKEKPDKVKRCIDSWSKFLPDYEIRQWDESNIDISSNKYLKQAYEAEKWAFAADYIRLCALYRYGGIYLDTDEEICRNIDKFLVCDAFLGYESPQYLSAGIIGAAKGHPLIQYLLSYYDCHELIGKDNSLNLTTIVSTITEMMSKKYSFRANTQYQMLADGVHVFPPKWFYPDTAGSRTFITPNTYAVHHYAASWLEGKQKSEQQFWNIDHFIKSQYSNKTDRTVRNDLFVQSVIEHISLNIKDRDYEAALLLCERASGILGDNILYGTAKNCVLANPIEDELLLKRFYGTVHALSECLMKYKPEKMLITGRLGRQYAEFVEHIFKIHDIPLSIDCLDAENYTGKFNEIECNKYDCIFTTSIWDERYPQGCKEELSALLNVTGKFVICASPFIKTGKSGRQVSKPRFGGDYGNTELYMLYPLSAENEKQTPYCDLKNLRIAYIVPHKGKTAGQEFRFEQMKTLQERGNTVYALYRNKPYEKGKTGAIPEWCKAVSGEISGQVVIEAGDEFKSKLPDIDILIDTFIAGL